MRSTWFESTWGSAYGDERTDTDMSEPALSPVIVIGMHRSGTSMLARMLETCGLFVGARKEDNHEALFFLELNDWLLRQSGGSWDHPLAIDCTLDEPRLKSLVVDYLHIMLDSRHAARYTGWWRYLAGVRPLRMRNPWGWKDPRSTFTLPLWLEIFPDARVIHLYRNGIDVASSLARRVHEHLRRAEMRHRRRKSSWAYWIRRKEGVFVMSPRCLSLARGFRLWEQYVTRAFEYRDLLGDKMLDVRFEDLTSRAEQILPTIVSFCGLRPSAERVRKAGAAVRPHRGHAYLADSSLRSFAEGVAGNEWMRRLGYARERE